MHTTARRHSGTLLSSTSHHTIRQQRALEQQRGLRDTCRAVAHAGRDTSQRAERLIDRCFLAALAVIALIAVAVVSA